MPAILLAETKPPVNMEEHKSEKKQKRSKSEHKKRPREDDEAAESRSHKKSKKLQDESDAAPVATEPDQEEPINGEMTKKSKKHKKSRDVANGDHVKSEPAEIDVPNEELARKSKKKHRKHDEEGQDEDVEVPNSSQGNGETPKKRKKDKSKKHKKLKEEQESEEETQVKRKSKKKRKERDSDDGADAMDLDEPAATTALATTDRAAEPSFPFYTQTISLYVPFFPIGFDKPITNIAAQHLEPLLNHYSPLVGGVLLAYRNVNLSERPVRPNPNNLPDDHTPTLLESVDEYAVGFGWLTADVDLFIPSRGAWMEGTVNLQSEGHIGVVCFGRFNASIEAKRLPAGWRWVDLANGDESANGTGKGKEKATFLTVDPDAPDGDGADVEDDVLDDSPLELAELHTTGYWVDESGAKVSAKPLRFRIKNFDIGVAGDYGYISIEGTTLDDDAEREMGRREREIERRRREKQNPAGLLRPMLRRVPEFSLTNFGKEEQEEDSNKKTVLYRGSRPGTPDD
jgi:DNA-directed RNA polymerase I subunit RPA43